MDVRLKCEKPDDILYTLTVTMTAGQWSALRDQLDTAAKSWAHPMSELRHHITDLLAQARKIYWPLTPPETLGGRMPAADTALIYDEHGPAAPAPERRHESQG